MSCFTGTYALYNATPNTDLKVAVAGDAQSAICTGSIALQRHGKNPEEPIRLTHEALRAGHIFRIEPDMRIVSLQVRVTFTGPAEERARVMVSLDPAGRPAGEYCCEVRGHNGASRKCTIGVLV